MLVSDIWLCGTPSSDTKLTPEAPASLSRSFSSLMPRSAPSLLHGMRAALAGMSIGRNNHAGRPTSASATALLTIAFAIVMECALRLHPRSATL